MGVAARSAAWGRKRRPALANVPGPLAPGGVNPAPTSADPIGVQVEINLGDLGWTDITPYVYYRDRIRITRGRADEVSSVMPQTCALTLNNRDGRFSPRNPAGPYYGYLRRNTQLRVSRWWNGTRWFRFAGEVSDWPVSWDISGTDVYAQITASGMLRRINQGQAPTLSAMARAYSLIDSPALAAYWPCEDAAGSSGFASALPGALPLQIYGAVNFASNSNFACSAALPVLNGAEIFGLLPEYDPAAGDGGIYLNFLLSLPSGEASGSIIATMRTSGYIDRMDLVYNPGVGGLQLICYDPLMATLATLNVGSDPTGLDLMVSMGIYPTSGRDTGSGITYGVQIAQVGGIFGASTFADSTSFPGHIFYPRPFNIGRLLRLNLNTGGGLTATAVGHVSAQIAVTDAFSLQQQLNAWAGEDPATRFVRVAGENSIPAYAIPEPVGIVGLAPNGVTMGTQMPSTLPTLLQDVVDADLGLTSEARDQVALVYRPRTTLYNQGTSYNPGTVVALDVAQHQLSGPLNPVEDDRLIVNDMTVTRVNGSSARAQETSGPLSVLPPPDGAGEYAQGVSVNVGSDAQLPDQAAWRVWLGTVDDSRYPQLALNLRHPSIVGSTDLMNSILSADIGDLVTIANPPPWLPPDTIRQIIQGYSEVLGVYEHDMTLVCSPEAPYRVAMLEDAALGRVDTDGSVLAAAVTATATTISVATLNPTSPPWTTDATQTPFDVLVGGERMTVTAVSGATSPQTMTVLRSVNGVVKAQRAGTDVRLYQPMIVSL